MPRNRNLGFQWPFHLHPGFELLTYIPLLFLTFFCFVLLFCFYLFPPSPSLLCFLPLLTPNGPSDMIRECCFYFSVPFKPGVLVVFRLMCLTLASAQVFSKKPSFFHFSYIHAYRQLFVLPSFFSSCSFASPFNEIISLVLVNRIVFMWIVSPFLSQFCVTL